LQHQRFYDGEPLAPPTGKRRGFHVEITQPGAAQDFRHAPGTIGFWNLRAIERSLNHRADGFANSEFRDLTNETEPRAFANCDVAGIRRSTSAQNIEERGFSGAIRADNADARAFGNDEGDILEKRRGAESFREALSADDRWQVCTVSPGCTVPE
jgi:hypothetical protein